MFNNYVKQTPIGLNFRFIYLDYKCIDLYVYIYYYLFI